MAARNIKFPIDNSITANSFNMGVVGGNGGNGAGLGGGGAAGWSGVPGRVRIFDVANKKIHEISWLKSDVPDPNAGVYGTAPSGTTGGTNLHWPNVGIIF